MVSRRALFLGLLVVLLCHVARGKYDSFYNDDDGGDIFEGLGQPIESEIVRRDPPPMPPPVESEPEEAPPPVRKHRVPNRRIRRHNTIPPVKIDVPPIPQHVVEQYIEERLPPINMPEPPQRDRYQVQPASPMGYNSRDGGSMRGGSMQQYGTADGYGQRPGGSMMGPEGSFSYRYGSQMMPPRPNASSRHSAIWAFGISLAAVALASLWSR